MCVCVCVCVCVGVCVWVWVDWFCYGMCGEGRCGDRCGRNGEVRGGEGTGVGVIKVTAAILSR